MKKLDITYYAVIEIQGDKYVVKVRFEDDDVSAVVYESGSSLPMCSYFGVSGKGGITTYNFEEILTEHLENVYYKKVN